MTDWILPGHPKGRITRHPVDSDSHVIKIVPKGLRAFDKHDADFFLELVEYPFNIRPIEPNTSRTGSNLVGFVERRKFTRYSFQE